MITRVWHGWTTPVNAPLYENLLRTEISRASLRAGLKAFAGFLFAGATVVKKLNS